jgi:hypothetical protein
MATEFNYVVNVDTTRVMGAMAEVRSQVGMALGSPTGFGGPAAGLPGGGFGVGLADVSGGISAGVAQMAAGFARGPGFMGGLPGMIAGSSFGGTFTNPAMAYTPHYGAIQAETSLGQEWLLHRYGMPAAQLLKPPGVSAAEYSIGVEKNFIDRQLEAGHQAAMGARTAFLSGVGGLTAGSAAQIGGAAVGGMVGARMATGLFGAGAAGAGRMVGGLAGGLGAFMLAHDFVGGAIQEHFAQVEQIGGVTRELGEIAGAGRGLGRTARYDLGVAARQAAKDLGMDVQEMGDVLALGRQHGMLPTATDPGKAREQFRDFARAIEEGAQILHTSLGNAASMIKGMTNLGFGAQSGMLNLVGMAGAAGISPEAMYGIGMAGAGFARQNLLSGRQGWGLFTGAVGSHGLGREELSMIGGVTGAAQMIGATQIGAALSPIGDMQLMAATGGQPLGGLFEMPGAAIGAMAQGGDIIGNMIRFQTHKREMLRGTGAAGIRTMARQQLESMADLLQDVSPTVSRSDAMRFMAMQTMGLNEVQAKAYVNAMSGRGGGGGGGGGGGVARAYQLEAMQGVMLGRSAAAVGIETPTVSAVDAAVGMASGFGFGEAIEGALTGAMVGNALPVGGTISGAIVGGIAGFAHQNWNAISGAFGGGPGMFASAEEKSDYYQRKMTAEYERRMSEHKRSIGYLEIDRGIAARAYGADLSGMRLDFDASARSPAATAQTEGVFYAMGMTPVAAGAGTIMVGGKHWSAAQAQRAFRQGPAAAVTGQDIVETRGAAYGAVYAPGAAGRFGGEKALDAAIGVFREAYGTLRRGPQGGMLDIAMGGAGETFNYQARRFIENIPDQKLRNVLLAKFAKDGIADPDVRAFLSQASGIDIEDLSGSDLAGRALAVAGKGLVETSLTNEAQMLKSVFGGQMGTAGQGAAYVEAETAYRNTLAEQQQEWDRQHPGVTPMDRIYATRPTADNYALQVQTKARGLTPRQLSTMSEEERTRISSQTAGSSALLDRYYRSLTETDNYTRGMAAAATGDWATANRLIQAGQQQVMVESKGELRGLEVEDIDVRKRYHRRGLPGFFGQLATTVGTMTGQDASDLLRGVDELVGAKVFSRTDMMEEAREAHRTVNKLKPRRRRQRLEGQRAIGWGQQEDAMSTIVKSLKDTNSMLKRTAGMIETLDKRINPGGNSAGTNKAPVGPG